MKLISYQSLNAPGTTGPHSARARWIELSLLACQAVLVLTCSAVLSMRYADTSPEHLYKLLGIYSVSLLAIHLLLCRFAPDADQLLFPLCAALNGLGLIFIIRLDASTDKELAGRQILWTLVGCLACVVFLLFIRNPRSLARVSHIAGLTGLILLALPLVWPQPTAADARIWLKLGPFSIQPGEFAKILFILFFAILFTQKRALFTIAGTKIGPLSFPRLRDLAPIFLVWALVMLIMGVSNDFGPALLFFLTVLGMLYIATARVSWLLIGIALTTVGSVLIYAVSDKIQQRVSNMRDPLANYYTIGNQLSESLFGLSSGGITGSGLGSGHPELIPLAHSDFILGAVGEELGLFGLAGVLLIFSLLSSRIFRIALRASHTYTKLMTAGFGLTLTLQVFIITGGISGLIPMTGLTTPFMSAGGSSIIANYIMLALLLRISHYEKSNS